MSAAGGSVGLVSGLVNVTHQLGGSLGLGILVTVFTAGSGHHAGAETSHELAGGVGASLTGSALFLALSLAVVVLVMRRPSAELAPAAQLDAVR